MDSVRPAQRRGYTELPDATPHDPANDHPVVTEAFEALNAFGGDMTRRTALQLLGLWVRKGELDAQARVALLRRFRSKGDPR